MDPLAIRNDLFAVLEPFHRSIILLDSKLKPWLLEVNISPSLHSSSTLDLDVKSPLATELFNMAR